ncbi:iron ABC transporter permease [Nostoc sp. FACHB-888]|uniref:FecCD family ABC transporter permease n=1 Tax=Nostoc sp. FACHB-888 TaxID=2692842 RepID=UPI0016891E19|nr:iron ABC transporter permease [Nostoc sp. FACHB-888]MBD2246555.1 iron ABC transporter permease [Nostoc sp. FACHB-888]
MNAKTPKRSYRVWKVAIALCLLLVILGLLALLLGTPHLSLQQLWEILVGGSGERITQLVVIELRLPRLILGMLTGASLALAGVLLQDSLRNPLAGPELLGISSGAATVMAAIIVLKLPVAMELHPPLALAGGLLGGGVVLLASRRITDPLRLVLIGAAITALLNALVIAIISLGTPEAVSLLFLFLLGSLAARTWDYVQLVLPWVLVGIPLALSSARMLNLLQLGDEVAEGLGLKVFQARIMIGLLSVGLVAAVVAACGQISYIALLAPHISRYILGTTDARQVLLVAGLLGAVLLVGADLVAREILAPQELPVGIWTTILGAPALLLLLRRQIGKSK